MRRRPRSGPVPGIRHERAHWERGARVVGVDEVGRGAWAGPVTVGAVMFPSDRRVYKLRDSKLLTPAQREHLGVRVRDVAVGVAVGHASNEEIDQIGMSRALCLAARRAVDALDPAPDVVLIDGNWDLLANYGTTNETIVRGDNISTSVAAASIVAKVTRDAIMRDADLAHPGYAFVDNKGYPAPAHLAALERLGPCALHRRSWAPIAALDQLSLFDGEPAQTPGSATSCSTPPSMSA